MDATSSRGPVRLAFPVPRSPRWPVARWYVLTGASGVVAGGIVAAVTGPTGLDRGSWVAAYLVLVVGVAQIAVGAGLGWFPVEPPSERAALLGSVVWNLGSAAVVIGTLVAVPALTTLGGVLTLGVLIWVLRSLADARAELSGWLFAFRLLVWFVLASVPVGLLLAWLRRG